MSAARHQRIKELFLAACDLEGEERRAFLARECGTDDDLRREVEELLGVDEGGVSVLERQALGTGPAGSSQAEHLAAHEVQRLTERAQARCYELGDELGRGGMGRILRIRDVDLRRDLAMKVSLGWLRGQAGPSPDTARFLEEARITARLDHPGIVPVHDLGVDGEGRLYFTMKLVQGRELSRVLELAREGAEGWNTTRVVGVLLQVCEAVAYAHAKGVVHRDLKPANVMVGEFGEVYVMDWGISRVLGTGAQSPERGIGFEAEQAAAEDSAGRTRAGSILGTPYSMPPEQARGEPVGPAADIYAVGAMLYQALSGKRPYEGKSGREPAQVVLARILAGPPRPLRELAPKAPPELIAITERAMAPSAQDRYADLRTMAEDLRAYLEGRVVRAYRTGALAELKKWIGRNRLAASGIAVALLAILGGLLWSRQAEIASSREIDLASDYFRARVVRDSVDELWPAAPASIPRLEDWTQRAERLLARRELHAERLLRLTSTPGSDPTELGRQRALVEYLDELDGRGREGAGLLEAVRARLAFARTIEERSLSGPEVARRWREAIAASRTHPAYAGLELEPQLGLVPLGPDPASGLLEFSHLETGAPAQRDAEGRIVMRPETGLVFVLVPGGTFHLGAGRDPESPNHDPNADQNERPVREVTLRAFLLSKYELTQAQWTRVTGRNPSRWPAESLPELTWTNPVENVDWSQAERVLGRMGLVLPTEARWEYACRAGTDTPFSVPFEELGSVANVADRSFRVGFSPTYAVEDFDDGFAYHAPVGSLAPNALGLHDMHGNVFEWTFDIYGSHAHPRAETDGANLGPEDPDSRFFWSPDYRVIRGGCFEIPAHYARASHRVNFGPTTINHALGLRPARDLERSERR